MYKKQKPFDSAKPLIRLAQPAPAQPRNFEYAGIWGRGFKTLDANVSIVKQSGSSWLALRSGTASQLGKPSKHNKNFALIAERGPKGDSVTQQQIQATVAALAEAESQKFFNEFLLDDEPEELKVRRFEKYLDGVNL
jgi:hypothetical protein